MLLFLQESQLVAPVGGWDTGTVASQKPQSIQAIEESNHEIQQAEEQLEKDLAELAAIMAEHDGK